MNKLESHEEIYFNLLIRNMKNFSNEKGKLSDEEINKAHRILGKNYKMLNIKTNEIEKIVKSNLNPRLNIVSILNVTEALFQTGYYQHGACGIILVQRRKMEFKDKKKADNILKKLIPYIVGKHKIPAQAKQDYLVEKVFYKIDPVSFAKKKVTKRKG